MLFACKQEKPDNRIITPWGEVKEDSIPTTDEFTMKDMVTNGELIMLTMSGPETYYDYHGHGMGTQYLLCNRFARTLGVSVRVEVCKDTAEMVNRLAKGEADVIAFMLPQKMKGTDSLRFCGAKNDSLHVSWAVQQKNTELADTLDRWFNPQLVAEVKKEEAFLLSARSVKRRVFSPMLNRKGGVISHYDKFFMTYAPMARWDWRLMAAQCYQESTFDPKARSWAGACGLMQIMPGTADHLGIPRSKLYEPEPNIAAAVKYIAELQHTFSDIHDQYERTNFVLASYNGGAHHIRDAMALAKRDGKNPHRWGDVSPYVLKLASPQYYKDPIVKHGYMRGSETVDYVAKIRQRHAGYQGVKSPHMGFHPSQPRKADKRKNKYDIKSD